MFQLKDAGVRPTGLIGKKIIIKTLDSWVSLPKAK